MCTFPSSTDFASSGVLQAVWLGMLPAGGHVARVFLACNQLIPHAVGGREQLGW